MSYPQQHPPYPSSPHAPGGYPPGPPPQQYNGQSYAPPPGPPPPNQPGWSAHNQYPQHQPPQQGYPPYNPYNQQSQYQQPRPGYPPYPPQGQQPPHSQGYHQPGHSQQYAPQQYPQQYGHTSPQQPPNPPPQQHPAHQGYPPLHPSGQQHPGAPVMGLSPGYDPNHMDPGDFRREADALRKAMKGFGTDEKALIGVLAKLNPGHIAAVRATYKSHIKRDLYSDVKSETSGYFRQGLLAIIDGPLLHDTALAREAVQGIGTKEWLLDDVLLGRSNADLKAIKDSYKHTYNRTLDRDVEADLSFKTKTLYMHVLRANRHEETMGFDPGQIQHDATSIHNATSARIVNNADEVSTIFGSYSNRELVELDIVFQRRYSLTLEAHIEKTFSGHMKDAFLRMLQTAKDPAMRDAVALEECMKGMGTKDEKLVVRVARVHWDRRHLDIVKSAYQHKYGRDLVSRVKGETSGDYQRLLVAMLE